MKKIGIVGLFTMLAILSCSSTQIEVSYQVTEDDRPPPPRVETVPEPPGPSSVWINGYWDLDESESWVWLRGHWAPRPGPGYVWQRTGWIRSRERYRLIYGRWVREENRRNIAYLYPLPPHRIGEVYRAVSRPQNTVRPRPDPSDMD